MLRHKATGNNGHSARPPVLVEYVPEPLRKRIEQAFEEEGIMEQSAERRILEALNANHKELTTTLHGHNLRLTLVEEDIKDFKKLQEDAADDRRDTKRLAKGSAIGAAMTLVVAAVMGFYGLRAPSAPEVKQDTTISNKLDELIKVMTPKREEPAEQPAPASVPAKRGKRPPALVLPVSPFGPGARLREGEIITTERSPRGKS
jgi:hypothetical protein